VIKHASKSIFKIIDVENVMFERNSDIIVSFKENIKKINPTKNIR